AAGIANGILEDQLVFNKLGARLQKHYAGYYPSLNATYHITENVQARLGLAQAVGRPDFGNILGATNVSQIDFNPASNNTGAALIFARAVRVFANATLVTNKSPAEADFRGFTPKLINWGFSYNRRPLSLVAKWTLVGKKKVGTIAASAIGASGWNYQAERLRLDL